MESRKSLTLYMQRVVILLCVESCRHFCNVTDMRRKPLACFGLCVGMVPKVYHHISGYNSRANGLVKRSHFDVHQSLFKAVDGDQKHFRIILSVLCGKSNISKKNGMLTIFWNTVRATLLT
jgi:hypothetical protein